MNVAIESATAMIGKSQNTRPLDRKIFKIPADVDTKAVLNFKVSFDDWDIKGLELDGNKLEKVE